MKYRILFTVTILASKNDGSGFPEGMPLPNSETQTISKKRFNTLDDADDYLTIKNGYSAGTRFFAKETSVTVNGEPKRAYVNAVVLPEL